MKPFGVSSKGDVREAESIAAIHRAVELGYTVLNAANHKTLSDRRLFTMALCSMQLGDDERRTFAIG